MDTMLRKYFRPTNTCWTPAISLPPANGPGSSSSPPQPFARTRGPAESPVTTSTNLHATPVQRCRAQGPALQTRHLPHPSPLVAPLRSGCLPGYTQVFPFLLRTRYRAGVAPLRSGCLPATRKSFPFCYERATARVLPLTSLKAASTSEPSKTSSAIPTSPPP